MKNTILSILAGIIASVFITYLGEFLLGIIFPTPANIKTDDFEALGNYIQNDASIAMFLGLGLIYALAAIVGAGVSAYLTNTTFADKKRNGYIVGGIIAAMLIFNFAMISHPVWFELLSLLLVFGGTLFGLKTGIEKSVSKS